jgi:hypothetical protein
MTCINGVQRSKAVGNEAWRHQGPSCRPWSWMVIVLNACCAHSLHPTLLGAWDFSPHTPLNLMSYWLNQGLCPIGFSKWWDIPNNSPWTLNNTCFKINHYGVCSPLSMACLPWFVSLQLYENSPPVLLSSPSPCGVISPHSTVSIPLALETQVIGAHRSIVYISVFGSQEAPLVSQFSESPSRSHAPYHRGF